MPRKVAIFIELHRFAKLRRDDLQRRPQAILIVGRDRQSQQAMVASIDRRRRLHPLAQLRMRPQQERQLDDAEDPGGDMKSPSPPGHPRALRHRPTISIFPARLRATTERSYMASACTGGTVYLPTLVAFITYTNCLTSVPVSP